jgi:hypothetical protein
MDKHLSQWRLHRQLNDAPLAHETGATDPAGSEGIHRAATLSEGTELRFSNHDEKTSETLGVVAVCDYTERD